MVSNRPLSCQTYNFDYNAWGQRTSVSVGNQILSTSEYEDVNSNAPGTGGGNKTKTTYGNGDSISYVYDKLDRLIKTVYNDSGEYVEYTYNGEGALSKLVHHQSNGTVIASYEFERDNLGRLIRSRQVAGNNATVQRTEHIYDAIGRISQQRWAVGGKNYSESYTYNDGETGNGALNTVTTATGDQLHYEYNDLQQLQYVRAKSADGTERFYNAYSYLNVSGDRTSNRVGFHNVRKADGSLISGFKYSYDALGNITKIAQSENNRYPLVTYSYDSLNQLVTETFYDGQGNGADHVTAKYTYTYDTAGNVRSISIGDQEIKTFTYSTGDWKDLLTSVTCGNTTHNLVYDAIGNPLTYGNGQQLYTNLTWEHGRQLASLTTGNKTYTFDYDVEGIRTEKNGNGANHEYITQNGKVVREIIRSADWTRVLDFIYDNSGRPFALNYSYDGGNNFDLYYYVLNYQGDVVALLDSNCNVVARYTYNAWGEILSATDEMAETNPLRYRGYYYDTETGFYYLQSRYYDPVNCRFINADTYTSTGQGLLGCNMFAYCRNNPVARKDAFGTADVVAQDFNEDNNPLNDLGNPTGGGCGGTGSNYPDITADTIKNQLQERATKADVAAPGNGPVAGTHKHTVFKGSVDKMKNPRIRTEVSYSKKSEVRYGTKNSVRFDVVMVDENGNPIRAWDLKTGMAQLSPSRISQMQKISGWYIPIEGIYP